MNNNAGYNRDGNNRGNNVNANQSKYQQKTEETQKTEFSQENNNLINDPNYCPIHGYHGQGSQVNAGMDVNANYGSEEIDNYRFYESKNVTRRVQNVNTNINTNINSNINTQHIVNTEENAAYMNAMNQQQMAQGEEGYDMSKLYVATKVTPVYSEMLDQQYQSMSHVCNVCGNPFDDNQYDMMQQNQMSSMQEVEYDINCPIHGQQRPQ